MRSLSILWLFVTRLSIPCVETCHQRGTPSSSFRRTALFLRPRHPTQSYVRKGWIAARGKKSQVPSDWLELAEGVFQTYPSARNTGHWNSEYTKRSEEAVPDKEVLLILLHGLGGSASRTWNVSLHPNATTEPTLPPNAAPSHRFRFSFRAVMAALSSRRANILQSSRGALGRTQHWPSVVLPPYFPRIRIIAINYQAAFFRGRQTRCKSRVPMLTARDRMRQPSDDGSAFDVALPAHLAPFMPPAAIRRSFPLHAVTDSVAAQLIKALDRLAQNSSLPSRAPLVFAGHSLGGLVVKDLLLRNVDLRRRTRGVCFFATPHFGTPTAANPGFWMKSVMSALARSLPPSRTLLRLNESFKALVKHTGMAIFSVVEGLPLSLPFRRSEIVVPLQYAYPRIGKMILARDKDHIQVCKAASDKEEVAQALICTLRGALVTLPHDVAATSPTAVAT